MSVPAGRTAAMGTTEETGGYPAVDAPFGRALLEVAQARPEIIGLSADLARYTDILPFAERFPERFFNIGMAEQNLVSVAAGLARTGYVPVATTYAVFATRRAYDFIAVQVAFSKLNVKIVAGLPGLTTGYGATHQGIDDLAHMRVLPNMVVVDPCDATDMEEATAAALEYEGPVYLRLLRGRVPVVLAPGSKHFELGRAALLREGEDVGIVASGIMLQRALEAADQLRDLGVSASVLKVSTLKPFDCHAVRELAKGTGALVTAENHSVIGGLFSAVAEVLARSSVQVPTEPVGVQDEFGASGSLAYLARRHRLSTLDVVEAAKRALGRKKRGRGWRGE
jgi:transketolase